LQYALKEAKTKSGGQKWYENQVTSNKVVSFFKDKRDINIHVEPLLAKRHISLELSETIHIGEAVSIVVRDKEGNIKSQSISEFQPCKSAIEKGLISTKYSFDDWQGNEDIINICEKYLKALEIIIKNGNNDGFLT
jgi:hypothetical protein